MLALQIVSKFDEGKKQVTQELSVTLSYAKNCLHSILNMLHYLKYDVKIIYIINYYYMILVVEYDDRRIYYLFPGINKILRYNTLSEEFYIRKYCLYCVFCYGKCFRLN